jgi:N-acetylglucosamine kinase-like BadF-type ATPase
MYILGIDSGATKSHVVLWDEAQAANFQVEPSLLNTKHPGLNLDVIPEAEATVRLGAMIEEAARVVEKDRPGFLRETKVVLGMAGLDTDLDRQNARRWLDQTMKSWLPEANYVLLSDVELGLWSAAPDGVGVLLIAGTGSNCFGRNAAGKTAKAGGLSHFFSDEGSGFMIGWKALHRLAQMYDGRSPQGPLFQAVLQQYALADFPSLKRKIVQSADYKHEVAKAAPAVQALAVTGDPECLTMIETEIAQLVLMVQTVYKQVRDSAQLPVFLVGGLFQHDLYREKLVAALGEVGITPQIKHIEFPVLGALRAK